MAASFSLAPVFAAALAGSLLVLAPALQGTAGTTGALTGTVTDAEARPVGEARVHVSSPSQIASATTDSSGSFTFLSLAPETYALSVEKNGYTPLVLRNVTILADQTRSLTIVVRLALREIGRVSTGLSDIVRPGTTSDVYSIGPATAEASQSLGAGANLQSAYSASQRCRASSFRPGNAERAKSSISAAAICSKSDTNTTASP